MDDRHARRRRRSADPRTRPVDGYRSPSPASFERLVDDAVASLPGELLGYIDNVQIVIEDLSPADLSEVGLPGEQEGILLGLYEGVPQTERMWGAAMLPDRITLYRRPIEARARSRAELAEVVRDTVVHEIAHHFGIDDDRLEDLGW